MIDTGPIKDYIDQQVGVGRSEEVDDDDLEDMIQAYSDLKDYCEEVEERLNEELEGRIE